METEKSLRVSVCKVDDSIGVVIGYAIICKELNDDGEFVEYEDLQGDVVEESAMLDAASDFMDGSRVAKMQHEGESIGSVVFGLPMTEDIADSLGITISKTGFIIGIKPESDAILKKFRDGELTGFSIGGKITQL